MIRQFLFGGLALLGPACGGVAAEIDMQALVAGAQKEGAFVWYTGSERDPAQVLLSAFRKKYPFLKADMVRASSAELASRIEAELASNRLQADAFEFSLSYLTRLLQDRNEIMQFDAPDYAAYTDEYSKSGYWAATGLSSIIIMYNTAKVGPADVPQAWSDLTKPFWKNKLVIDNLEVSGTGYNWLYDMVGPGEPGWPLIEAIGQNKPGLERGHAGIAQKVAAGEYAAAIEMSDFHLFALLHRSANAPVHGAWPKEGVPREVWSGGIFKRAPHPNAARLFQAYMLSQEGQTVYTQAMGRQSARSDVTSPPFPGMPANVRYIHRSDADLLKDRPALVAQWKKAWGLN